MAGQDFDPNEGHAVTLPINAQVPSEVLFNYIEVPSPGGVVTPIVRLWPEGTDPENCRLCPREQCSYVASHRVCLVSAPDFVPEDQLRSFSGVRRQWAEGSAANQGPRLHL